MLCVNVSFAAHCNCERVGEEKLLSHEGTSLLPVVVIFRPLLALSKELEIASFSSEMCLYCFMRALKY
jgi:hypothetical protein